MGTTVKTIFAMVLACSAIVATSAHAESGALITDVTSPRAGLQVMDHLKPGQMIMLGSSDRLVLTYTSSCSQETIVGGVVSIGADKSIVAGGKVTTEKTECRGGTVLLSEAQSTKSAVMVFRTIPKFAAAQ
jgi:hypothetical protein